MNKYNNIILPISKKIIDPTELAARCKSLSIAVIGHVDNGKSTLVGHLLTLTGHVSGHKIKEYEKEGAAINKASFKFAWVTDTNDNERKRGVTVEASQKSFSTQNREFTILDCPGHEDYMKNLIFGLSQADCALLVVTAEALFNRDDRGRVRLPPQTIEHLMCCVARGISKIVVVINKMDVTAVNYSQEHYNALCKEIEIQLKGFGCSNEREGATQYSFIPVSAWAGENLIKPSSLMPWFTGLTLVDELDRLPEAQKDLEEPFVFQVGELITTKKGMGTICTGNVLSGLGEPDSPVIVKPSHKKGTLKSMEAHRVAQPYVIKGDSIGVTIRGVDKEYLTKGAILANPEGAPKLVQRMVVDFLLVKIEKYLYEGAVLNAHINTALVPLRVAAINHIIDKTGKKTDAVLTPVGKKGVPPRHKAEIELQVTGAPVICAPYSSIKNLGIVILRDQNKTIGYGKVLSIVPDKSEVD